MKKITWQKCLSIMLPMLAGAICGILIAIQLIQLGAFEEYSSIMKTTFLMAIMLLEIYLGIFLQIILHETGHLIFGLLTGYRFCSFRIMNFMWIKTNGKIKFKKLSLVGTGGQCLMVPPDRDNDNIPVVLYNIGGVLVNLIDSLIFFLIYQWCKDIPYLSILLLILVIWGIESALVNGIPMNVGPITNDGCNTLVMYKSNEIREAFSLQLKINEKSAQGTALKDMPKEWFFLPDKDKIQNSILSTMGVFYCNRLMEEHNFAECKKCIQYLLEKGDELIGLHRNLLTCDFIYCEILEGNLEELSKFFTKELKKFIKSMKNSPSVIRTQYAYALIVEKDTVRADKYKELFEKISKTYPYPNEIETELKLMKIMDSYKDSQI